jgi:hypothetical protein
MGSWDLTWGFTVVAGVAAAGPGTAVAPAVDRVVGMAEVRVSSAAEEGTTAAAWVCSAAVG